MIFWLMNMGFAGGDGEVAVAVDVPDGSLNKPKRGNLLSPVIQALGVLKIA